MAQGMSIDTDAQPSHVLPAPSTIAARSTQRGRCFDHTMLAHKAWR